MAFNIVKGNVQFSGNGQGTIEDMVDDHSDQTIGGTKTFSNIVTASAGLSASFFYGNGTNLTGITEPAIVTYDGAATNRIIVGSYNNNVVSGAVGLTYDGSSLNVIGDVTASAVVSASAFHGSAASLKSIPINQFVGSISAADLSLGSGLTNSGGNLTTLLASNSGLALVPGGLTTDVSTLSSFSSLDNADSLPIYDNDASSTKRTTITTLATHIRSNFFSLPAGTTGNLQFHNGSNTFGNSDNLNYNTSTDTLSTISGSFRHLSVEGVNDNQTLFTLNKSENSASYIEFRNEGLKYAEIFGTSAETLIMRTTTTGSSLILRQGGTDILTLSAGNATFSNYKVRVNNELQVNNTTSTKSRIHAVSVHTASYNISNNDETVLFNGATTATASLPTITSGLIGLTLTIKRTGVGAVHVSGSDTIDSIATFDLEPQGAFMRIIAADFGGSNYGWAIIAKSGSF